MPHITSRSWTPEDIEKLKLLVRSGASPMRAGVALKRKAVAVQVKARSLGLTFRRLNSRRGNSAERVPIEFI